MKKYLLGVQFTAVGALFAALILNNAMQQPWDYNGIVGLPGALLGTGTLAPFVIALLLMAAGLVLSAIATWKKE